MITVVSGLPRSGTSLMMQMLAAGGLRPLTDGARSADRNNPRGYYEWEKVKQLPQAPGLIAQAEGKVVKVISSLLLSLPMNYEYRVVFMRRPLNQVVASQDEMVRQLNGGASPVPAAGMQAALETHLRSVEAWLNSRTGVAVHWVDYPNVIAHALDEALAVATYLGGGLDVEAMAAQVDPSLLRNRTTIVKST